MKLSSYLKRSGESDAEFAARCGMHRTEIWNFRTGRRTPRAAKVAAIERATRGQVRAADLITE